MRVEVIRLPGDRQGPDVVDALLTTEAAGLARGRGEIDYHGTSRVLEATSGPLLPWLAPGSPVEVQELGRSYRGLVREYMVTIEIEDNQYSAATTLNVEREL
jgi:hypothetical protein